MVVTKWFSAVCTNKRIVVSLKLYQTTTCLIEYVSGAHLFTLRFSNLYNIKSGNYNYKGDTLKSIKFPLFAL